MIRCKVTNRALRRIAGLLCLLVSFQLMAQKDSLQISLLTSSPYEGEVFTVYGHAALRSK